MNEELQEELVKRFTNRFSKYNEKVLREIGEVIKQLGDVIPSDAYKLAQQLKYNTTVKDLEMELSKITKKSIQEIQQILEHIAKENIQFATPYYEARGLSIPVYEKHKELQKLVNSLTKLSGDEFINISQSTGFKLLDINKNPLLLNIEETYNKVIDEAVYAVTTGKDSYNQLMREMLKQLSSSGVRKIEYESGYSRRIDTAVRMNLMDTIRQVSNETSQLFGKEFGSDGVEVSVHINPAPDHAEVQGHQFSNEEFEKFQNHIDCVDYKGNFISHNHGKNDRRSISEYNCYHYIFPVILGVSNPIHTDEELRKIIDNNNIGVEVDGKHYTNYELTQLQHKIETEIRKAKEQQIIAKASGNDELVLNSEYRITQLKNKYVQISKQANLRTDVNKTYVSGYIEKKIQPTLSDKIVKNLEKIGIRADNTLNKIDKDLLEKNVEQITKLAKKYNMEEFFDTMDAIYMCVKRNSMASVGYNEDITQIFINSSSEYFNSKEKLISTMKTSAEANWCMPCSDDKLDIYTMTHEFGHALEINIFKKEYPFGGNNEFKLFCNKAKNDILMIAEKNNPKFDYFSVISGYGSKENKPSEFFAEVFASMEIGKPNELTKAMKAYFKERGIL